MDLSSFDVDPDITRAATLDPSFYASEAAYAATRERIFARTWQWLGDLGDVAEPSSLSPRTLLPGLLDEPLLLARDDGGTLRCLSNVCTHRGNLLIGTPCRAEQIRCSYHSRRFDLTGRMTFMPEFAAAKEFPTAADDLPQVPFAEWAGHGFAALDPRASFNEVFDDLQRRLAWLPVERYRHAPGLDNVYDVAAHWALYVENYLEGFHIAFVHKALNQVVDYGSYATELFRCSSLQLALARTGESAFDPPPGSPDYGQRVAAYYWWIFPNLMLNFYPWGLSVNRVEPQGLHGTRIVFRSYVGDAAKLGEGAGGALDRVEAEDEAIVEAVARGVRSRLYRGGRYSPAREAGVHHFHRLLCESLAAG